MKVALAGLATGVMIALAFTSFSTGFVFAVIIAASIALAVLASSIRALRDDTDSPNDLRNVAALPLDRLPLIKDASANAPSRPDPDRDEHAAQSGDDTGHRS